MPTKLLIEANPAWADHLYQGSNSNYGDLYSVGLTLEMQDPLTKVGGCGGVALLLPRSRLKMSALLCELL